MANAAPLDIVALARKPGGEPLLRYLRAYGEAQAGRPRALIEGYLWVKDLQERLVPFKFTPEQEYYYAETFGKPGFTWETSMTVEVLKHREAFSTLFWSACGFAFFCACDGFVMNFFIDVESKLGKTVIPIFDNFRNNMAPIEIDVEGKHYSFDIKPPLAHQDMQFWEVEHHAPEDGQVLSSFINFIPAGSSQALRGGRSKMTVYSERDWYELVADQSLGISGIGGKTAGSWEINESSPRKATGSFYALYKALRNDEVPNGILLVRLWPQKLGNRLHEGVRDGWLKRDWDEIHGTGTLKLTEEEVLVTSIFPDDGIPVIERIGWRRAKIQEYVIASFGDSQRGKAAFLQEFMEDTDSCWTSLAEGRLPEERLKILRLVAPQFPPLRTWVPFPQMKIAVWEMGKSDPYIAFLDPALGGGKAENDYLCMKVLNQRTGMDVARVYGKAFVDHFVTQCVQLLRDPQMFGARGEPLLGIEVNGNGQRALKQAQDLGYRNLYRRPVGGRAQPGTFAALERGDLGLNASGSLVTTMHNAMYAGLYSGDVTTYDTELFGSLMVYNPNDERQHCPDDVAAFRGLVYLFEEAGGKTAAPVRNGTRAPGRVIVPVSYL